MTPIRVFLVDDAVAVRRMLSQILEAEPDIEVAGTAGNGLEALQRLPKVNADLIVLDVEMPDMGGLDLLRELRKAGSRLPVLLFSSVTERGAMVTIEALLLGADDYVTKPSGLGAVEAAREYIRRQLLPRIRQLARPSAAASIALHRAGRQHSPERARTPIDAVVIGVSTGGPRVLHHLVPALPADLPVPVFIVQHMPAFFTGALARRLDQVSALAVRECEQELAVLPGMVIIAAGGSHLVLERRGDAVIAGLDKGEPENSCRPAANVLFRSAVSVYGGRILALVLTGMGDDGLAGSLAVHAAGGLVIVQDEGSSVVWGMPGSVQHAGLADQVLPASALADAIVAQAAVGRTGFSATVRGGLPSWT